jgi:hypothetical protein
MDNIASNTALLYFRPHSQVLAANKIYMTARRHAVFFSRAQYPIYSAEGVVSSWRNCDPWDRCW